MHIHKITIHYGLIRAIKLHNSFFLTLGYRIQMHVSTIQGNFNKLLTSKTTKASINEKIFMINKTQWGEFQCFSATAFSHSNFDISLILFHWRRGNFCNLNSTWQCFLAFVKTKRQTLLGVCKWQRISHNQWHFFLQLLPG